MKKTIFTFLIIGILFSVSIFSQDAAAIYREGQQNLRAGEFSKAIDRFTDVLTIDPNFYFAYLNLGIAYRRSGNPDEAIPALEEAGRISERDERFFGQFAHHLELAAIYMQKRETDKAVIEYKAAIEKLQQSGDDRQRPRLIRALSSLGEIYYYTRRDYQATYDLLKGPYDAGYRETDLDVLLGKAAARLNKRAEALNYYKNSNIMALDNLESKDYYSLVEFWTLAVSQQDNNLITQIANKMVNTPKPAEFNAEAHLFQARSYIIANNYRQAVEALKKAIGANYDKPEEAYKLKGIAYFNMENFSDAERTLKASLQRDQSDAEVFYYLGLSLARQEKRTEAKEQYEKALQIRPDYNAVKEALEIVEQQIEQDRLKAEEEEEFRRLEEEGKVIIED